MRRLDVTLRWLGAIGITLAPLGLFVLPGLLNPEPYETAEEQFTAFAEGVNGVYPAQMLQLFGSICLMVSALGIGGITIARRRGRTLGVIGLATGVIGAIALLLVIGFELAMLTVLMSGTDTQATVAQVIEIFAQPSFGIPLMVGLVGFFVTLPLLALALWRSRIVPLVVPLLFVLPVVVGFVPLPIDATVAGGVALLVPCVWMSAQLIRGVVTKAGPDTAVVAAASAGR
ncbi:MULTISPECIES: hypothetical protein [Microbacterium]|uniref:hypothetical protein n=1 Tax=Microbacterium TaxID=33882 RepID=UPI000D64B795|nr:MULTISPECIES: hypothetical protein [Microbacterium]